ncbi:hypothetical protein ACP275_13G018500 [Erythranthe tilingii]
MSNTNEVEFTLKVMINKHKTKVLFAEIDSNFADVLLSFLTLPLGTIIKVLKKHYGEDQETRVNIGSITTLYNGLANLDIDHFETEAAKEMLLDPISAFDAECRKLKLDISDTNPTKYYPCQDWFCRFFRWSNISMHSDNTGRCSRCGKMMTKEVRADQKSREDGDSGVFTINTVSFLISDDLMMVPNVAVPTVKTLRNLGITNIDGAELMNVTFGFIEVMDLLKGSLLSRTPLTDIILDKREGNSTKPNFQPEILLSHEKEKEANFSSKNLLLKLIGQRSTNKLLFAQGDEAFIDFLFRLLTIPLGGVERLLGGNTCLRSIDNLYRSVTNLIDGKYLATPDIKTAWLTYSDFGNQPVAIYAQGDRNYVNFVKGPKMCMVSDDLTVTPSSMSSSLSILSELNIKVSDVETVEMQIGLHEGLSILKASLTSASALTDALKINHMIKKQPKQEH